MQRLAITVYFELLLVATEFQSDYIKHYFPTEEVFWDTIENTEITLPYLQS
jgi:hypothetical protein